MAKKKEIKEEIQENVMIVEFIKDDESGIEKGQVKALPKSLASELIELGLAKEA